MTKEEFEFIRSTPESWEEFRGVWMAPVIPLEKIAQLVRRCFPDINCTSADVRSLYDPREGETVAGVVRRIGTSLAAEKVREAARKIRAVD